MIEYNKLDNWIEGYFIRNNQNIGTVVPIEPTPNSDWKYQVIQVSKGDKVYCRFSGGSSARAIAILDDEYKMVYNSGANVSINGTYVIEQDGFIILETWSSNPLAYHYPFSQDNTDLGRVFTTHNHGDEETEGSRNIGKGYIQDKDYQPGDLDVNEQMSLLGKYGVTKIGNQLWTTENLDEELGTIGVDEWYYNGRSKATYINTINSTYKALSTDYQLVYVYDWNDGHTSSNLLSDKAVIPGKYIRVHFVATMNKAQLAPVTITTRFAAWNDDFTSIVGAGRMTYDAIPAGETTKTFDVSFEASDLNLEGIARFDFLTTHSGTGIDGTTRIDFTDIKIFSSAEAYTSTPTNAITVPQALVNEKTANNYGRLYTWSNLNTNLSKLGLIGWRLPNRNDFGTLVNMDSTGSIFRDNSYNGGTNTTGLTLKHVGYRSFASQNFVGDNSNGSTYLWSNETTGNNVYALNIYPQSIGSSRNFNKNEGFAVRLVLDMNEDGSYPTDATPLKVRETYKPYNRNIGTGAMPYIPNDENGMVYVDDVRCDIVCPHDKP